MMEYANPATWEGAPVLGAFEMRKKIETDISWAMHMVQGETEQEMRRRWLTHHLEAQRGVCAYCGVDIRIHRRDGGGHLHATVDHIIPLSKGGADVVENTLAACRRCNLAKGSTDLDPFLVSPELEECVALNHPCPDRVSAFPGDPDFDHEALCRGIRVWINGVEHRKVLYYDRVAGEAQLYIRKVLTKTGRPMTLAKKGVIRPLYWDVIEAMGRVRDGSFRTELTGWLASRVIPEVVRVRSGSDG